MAPRVFFVTGTSSGFGQHLVEEILEKGDKVVATARKPESLNFQNTSADNYLALHLDVTDRRSIDQAFEKALSTFGRIDVVVNNAGYGLCGPFEELAEDQIRRQVEVNFFGLMDITRQAVEILRSQSPPGGLIQQISSMGGQKGMPTFSIYCATKFAVEGFTEAVAAEMKPEWGIHFTCVEPGGFRTNWAGGSMAFPEKRLPEYDHIDAQGHMNKRHGTQKGDPVKAGQAIYKLAVMKDPPARVLLGSDAREIVMKRLKESIAMYDSHIDITNSTDVEE